MIGLRIQVIGLGPTIRVIGFRIRVFGAMVGLNTLGDMPVRFQVGSDHPSDWIQDLSAWSHGWIVDPTIHMIGCNQKLNQALYWKGDLVHLPSKSKIDLVRIMVRNSELMQRIS